nr:inosine-uridine preferring nucleoside hydrolase [Riptortus pedestris]
MVYKNKIDPYFGYDGLGDSFSEKPYYDFTKHEHAALALADIVKKRPGEITILCIGPLTNIALALHIYPRLLEDVKEVVILGGSYQGGGGTRPGVEFNTYSDPEASAFVFSKVPVGKTVTVIPSETSHQVAMPLDWRLNTLGKLESCFIEFLNRAEGVVLKRARVWSISDQVAAAIILNPAIIKSTKDAYLLVETCGNTSRGAVFRDDRHKTTNVRLITEVDKEGIQTMLLEYLNDSPKECKFS